MEHALVSACVPSSPEFPPVPSSARPRPDFVGSPRPILRRHWLTRGETLDLEIAAWTETIKLVKNIVGIYRSDENVGIFRPIEDFEAEWESQIVSTSCLPNMSAHTGEVTCAVLVAVLCRQRCARRR